MYQRSPSQKVEKQGNGYIVQMCGHNRLKAYEIVSIKEGKASQPSSLLAIIQGLPYLTTMLFL